MASCWREGFLTKQSEYSWGGGGGGGRKKIIISGSVIDCQIMPFLHHYNGAMRVLASIGTGKCQGTCKSAWIRNLRYALKTKTNPLKLTPTQRKTLRSKLESMRGKNATDTHARTLKKYKTRKSPPYPANDHCNQTKEGNDGHRYVSTPNQHGVCSWKKKT